MFNTLEVWLGYKQDVITSNKDIVERLAVDIEIGRCDVMGAGEHDTLVSSLVDLDLIGSWAFIWPVIIAGDKLLLHKEAAGVTVTAVVRAADTTVITESGPFTDPERWWNFIELVCVMH